jgi:hypothetical protein
MLTPCDLPSSRPFYRSYSYGTKRQAIASAAGETDTKRRRMASVHLGIRMMKPASISEMKSPRTCRSRNTAQ